MSAYNLTVPAEIQELVDRKALFVVNHSGGKDSQAMHILLRQLIPSEQILVIHAELPGVDWKGTMEHARDTTIGYEFQSCVATKTFMDMVDSRQMWPSPKYRQCTSDLKRGPIERTIRHHIKATGHTGLIVSCMGLRAEESSARAKAVIFKHNARNSKAGREWYEWLPIHDMLETEVFGCIEDAGEKPHWAYAAGMSRLSCCFCIMASKKDFQVAAKLNPEMYEMIVNKEKEIDQTMTMPVKGVRTFLEDHTGITVSEAYAMRGAV